MRLITEAARIQALDYDALCRLLYAISIVDTSVASMQHIVRTAVITQCNNCYILHAMNNESQASLWGLAVAIMLMSVVFTPDDALMEVTLGSCMQKAMVAAASGKVVAPRDLQTYRYPRAFTRYDVLVHLSDAWRCAVASCASSSRSQQTLRRGHGFCVCQSGSRRCWLRMMTAPSNSRAIC